MPYVPLKALQAFEAVGRLGSATLAAHELGVTPGAVSKQLKNLEEHLGLTLLDRAGARLSLTHLGGTLHERVTHFFAGLQNAVEDVGRTRASGELTLQCMPAFTTHYLIPRLGDFHQRFPDVSVRILPSIAPHRFLHSDIDVGILFGRQGRNRDTEFLFGEMEFFPVCSPSLVGSRTVRLNDLARSTLIDSLEGIDWYDWFAMYDSMPPPEAARLRFGDFNHVLAAARQGLGFAMGDNITTERDLRAGVLMRPFPGSIRSLELGYYIALNRDHEAKPQVAAFLDWIRQVARSPAVAL